MPKQEQYGPKEVIETTEEEGEKEPSHLTSEDLKHYSEELKTKVEQARLQREKDIERKLVDRESLIAQMKENDELLKTAQETFDYFTTMQELGELKDPVDLQRLEEIKELVASLERQEEEISKRIDAISSRPEILEKLYEGAKKEGIERTSKEILEQTQAPLDSQIRDIGEKFKSIEKERDRLFDWIKSQERIRTDIKSKFGKIIDEARSRHKKEPEFFYELGVDFAESKTAQDFQNRLQERRNSLGVLKGKEKAVIDFILFQTEDFKTLSSVETRIASLRQESDLNKQEIDNLANQYKNILKRAYEAEKKIIGLGLPQPDLRFQFSRKLRGLIGDRAENELIEKTGVADILWKEGEEELEKIERETGEK